MYRLISVAITILLLPITVPMAIYAGLKYRWQDTVPEDTASNDTDEPSHETVIEWLMDEGYTEQEALAYVNQEKKG